MNLLENIVTDMTPEEFECYCLELLNNSIKDLSNYHIEHNKIYKADDGSYQLDGYIEFELMGVKYKTIVECKKYKSPVKRSHIQVLKDTIINTGAQKGIFISTSSFQSGAMKYAKKHGIALMQVVNGYIVTLQNSAEQIYSNRMTSIPRYVFAYYDLDLECPIDFIHIKGNENLLSFWKDN